MISKIRSTVTSRVTVHPHPNLKKGSELWLRQTQGGESRLPPCSASESRWSQLVREDPFSEPRRTAHGTRTTLLHSSLASPERRQMATISFPFTLLRTLLYSAIYYLPYFQELTHSLRKTPTGRYPLRLVLFERVFSRP